MARDTITSLSVKIEMFKEVQDEMKQDIKWIHTKLDRNFEEFASIIKDIQKENDEKYANKNIEKRFYGFVWIILVSVLYAILSTIWI
jgi:spore coat polysaccharide biosynthesis predicted glycosyltransferase SpsG